MSSLTCRLSFLYSVIQVHPSASNPNLLPSLNLPIFDFQRRQCHPIPVLLPGKFHGRGSLVGSPWCCLELDMTEQLHFHFSLSCIGEGNSNSLQCSCLENPRDGGQLDRVGRERVAQSWTGESVRHD